MQIAYSTSFPYASGLVVRLKFFHTPDVDSLDLFALVVADEDAAVEPDDGTTSYPSANNRDRDTLTKVYAFGHGGPKKRYHQKQAV